MQQGLDGKDTFSRRRRYGNNLPRILVAFRRGNAPAARAWIAEERLLAMSERTVKSAPPIYSIEKNGLM
jgi:hypothetical protein